MTIAVASGKGGTGKTTISLSLASYVAMKGTRVAILDCDVEEPNVNLFLNATVDDTKTVSVLIPRVDDGRCTGCGECERICAYSAIVLIKGKPLVLPDLCHSCGGCFHVCPEKAIMETEKEIGIIESGSSGGIIYAGGRLNIGGHLSPPLIKEVKKTNQDIELRMIDCPPGTSCPVIESVRGCDFLLLVTEPTPFGLNDLRLAVDMARAMEIPFGVAVNRADAGDERVNAYCREQGIAIVASIPYSREIAESYSRGNCVSLILKVYEQELESMIRHIGTETAEVQS